MKRIFSHPLVALTAGLCLRLFFVIKHPVASAGDTALYQQMATNWLQHRVYAMDVNGAITPVDLRMPGYPAYLALTYWLSRKTGDDARLWVMLGQVATDLGGAFLIAQLAKILAERSWNGAQARRVWLVALWLAMLCPFTANYAAVQLTEVFAVTLTALTCCLLAVTVRRIEDPEFRMKNSPARHDRSVEYAALGAGVFAGLGTLFRPETPLVLIPAAGVIAWMFLRQGKWSRAIWTGLALALGCFAVLIPWGVRNQITLGELQFLAPKNSNLPGELVPYGFMAWEKTWLFRVKDCYLVPWRLNGEPIYLEDLPPRAFDTAEEKQRVAALLEQYNNDVTLNAEEDAAFGELARERTSRHPLRTYLWLPVLRAFTIWFTPRIELLPFSGQVFPVKQAWQEDPIDFSFTLGFFLLNVAYVLLALRGARRLWQGGRTMRWIVVMFAGFILLRTAFLTTLETPEPRYVLECYPVILALAAQVFVGHAGQQHAGQQPESTVS